MSNSVAIIGAGAAGYFAAVNIAENNPSYKVQLFEASKKPLAKLLISGGGRCNVTHHCFEVESLVESYPRGSKELRGPFSRFQPRDTMDWFERRGVKLKVEADNRVFPITDDSSTVADCLKKYAKDAGVKLFYQHQLISAKPSDKGFCLSFKSGNKVTVDKLVLCSGSSRAGYKIAESFGHTIVSPVPSLFTFKSSDSRLNGLSGVSVPWVSLQLLVAGVKKSYSAEGPLLITHWGLSGPAVIKLSAFAARSLYSSGYKGELVMNLIPEVSKNQFNEIIELSKKNSPKKKISNTPCFEIPKSLWSNILDFAFAENIPTWSQLIKSQEQRLYDALTKCSIEISGKGEFKEEFVTAGGVELKEVNFKTMESKLTPGLFFAGEILDVDGVTGGFNFQNAWTTAWIIGGSI